MTFLKEESFFIDYLTTFELMNELDDLKEERTVLDKVIDANYKKQIEAYIEQLINHSDTAIIHYFIGEKYNLLFSIARFYGIFSFDDYLICLQKLEMADISEVLCITFDMDMSFNLLDIEGLNLSFDDKWKIAVIMKEFNFFKEKLIVELQENYHIYMQYAETLYHDYQEKIKEVEESLYNPESMYAKIMADYLDREAFEKLDRRLILLLSANHLSIYSGKLYPFIAIGLYILDAYSEQERQKKLDEVKLSKIIKILSDPTRYGIIKSINSGITTNSVLAKMFSISRAGISMQFKMLQENDIIFIDEQTKQYVVNKDILRYALEAIRVDMEL